MCYKTFFLQKLTILALLHKFHSFFFSLISSATLLPFQGRNAYTNYISRLIKKTHFIQHLFNQDLIKPFSLCINTFVCLKINQYSTGLFVSYSRKNPIAQTLNCCEVMFFTVSRFDPSWPRLVACP